MVERSSPGPLCRENGNHKLRSKYIPDMRSVQSLLDYNDYIDRSLLRASQFSDSAICCQDMLLAILKSMGITGERKCFMDFYTFQRCCTEGVQKPWSHSAQQVKAVWRAISDHA